MNKVPIDRIRYFLVKLSDERTSRKDRLSCWRLISSAALDQHEIEVQQMDALNAVMADPSFTSGAPIA